MCQQPACCTLCCLAEGSLAHIPISPLYPLCVPVLLLTQVEHYLHISGCFWQSNEIAAQASPDQQEAHGQMLADIAAEQQQQVRPAGGGACSAAAPGPACMSTWQQSSCKGSVAVCAALFSSRDAGSSVLQKCCHDAPYTHACMLKSSWCCRLCVLQGHLTLMGGAFDLAAHGAVKEFSLDTQRGYRPLLFVPNTPEERAMVT